MERHPETGRLESEEERADRNLQELLGELRIALPTVHHRISFRHQDKEYLVVSANRLAVLWYVVPIRRRAQLGS